MSLIHEGKVSKQTQIYRKLGQGLKIFHEDQDAEVDILAVPGLGTNPQECWTWESAPKSNVGRSESTDAAATTYTLGTTYDIPTRDRGFNWLRDKDGLAAIFPRSRIMLYDYASAWQGKRKVKATMKGICGWLLDDLREKRKGSTEVGRPLILIGHSMGGVVVAKMLCMARGRSEFEGILTCTVGCLFFGAPFRGTNMAKIAMMYSSVYGVEAYDSLLSFMRAEKNDTLDEVTSDFMEICNKLVPAIDLVCAYETVPTNVSYSQRMADSAGPLLQHRAFKAGAKALLDLGSAPFKTGTHFVEEGSAVLQGSHPIGLQADHRDLVKFESISSEKFVPIKVALVKMVQMSKTNARKRVLLSGQSLLSQGAINQVRQSLEGVDMRLKFRTKVNQRSISSWLSSEPLYISWLARGGPRPGQCSYLWLRGAAGLGKTNAALAAIQNLNETHLEEQQFDSAVGHGGALMAFFLCEWAPGCNTAEDLLQALIVQIINQDESLAQHGARWFLPHLRYRGAAHEVRGAASSAKATATVDNLWRCLQDMFDDPAVNSIHLIINNIHLLESGTSTNALLAKFREDADNIKNSSLATPKIKWLVTSRNDRHITQSLNAGSISAIDLENDHEYGAKVKGAHRQHAKDAISRLRSSKAYSTDLTYYITNSIDDLSENESWIDVFCILLEDIPNGTNSLTIQNWVNEVSSYNIHKLIDHAWDEILHKNQARKLEIQGLLRFITIAYEPPTITDLAVFTQYSDLEHLSDLISSCSPFLEIGSAGEHQGKVVFTNPDFADHFQATAYGRDIQDNSEKQRHHGMMALRCFNNIKASLKSASARDRLVQATSKIIKSSNLDVRIDSTNLIDFSDDGEDYLEPEVSSASPSSPCSYSIKYLFRHLSEGGPDLANLLCDDDPDFWGQKSSLRNAWLREYQILTNEVKDLSTHGMSALHVAAGIGAKELVSILVKKNSPAALSWASDDGMTPLHVAAFNDRAEVVDALIRSGADIELGEGTSGTALHIAALRGNCQIMSMLINEKANINATSQEIGPVINAAILSGTVDAVKQIMDGDVRFDLDYTKWDAPLSLSARMSEPRLFQDILETGKEKWRKNVKLVDQALIAASYNGRLESVRTLLRFGHDYTHNTMEKSILSAATEKKWASVNELLDYVTTVTGSTRWEVRLDDAFYLACTSKEEQIEVLTKMWAFSKHHIPQEILDYSLYQATVMRKENTVVWLLETCGANANATAEKPTLADSTNATPLIDYSTALNAAASSGNSELVKTLLEKGAIIDGEAGYALQVAASEGHNKVVQTLLIYGAIVNKQVKDSDEIGFFSGTALQAACENSKLDVVHTLLAHGANPNLGGGPSSNPITAAAERGLPDVLRALLAAPDINVNVSGGTEASTPLINAASHMPTEIVELLLNHGANINARNALGDTALIMAAVRGEKAAVEVLCNRGADVTYRSPQRGLAIQVAAQSRHPLCAHVIAERMAGIIEHQRETGLADAATASERLAEAAAELNRRNAKINALNSILDEKVEELQVVTQDVEVLRFQKEQILSMGALQGETYNSITLQNRAMQDERVELLKQLSATKGQLGLANETITRMQRKLEDERKTNSELRKRKGWTALQEERNTAVDQLAQEKQAFSDTLKLEKENIQRLLGHSSSLENEIQKLQNKIKALKEEEEKKIRQLSEQILSVKAQKEEGEEKSRQLSEQILSLEDDIRALEENNEALKEEVKEIPQLRTQVASMKDETQLLKAMSEVLKEDQETREVLSSHISSLEEEIKSLKSKNEAAEEDEAKSQHLRTQVASMKDETQLLKAKNEVLKEEVKEIPQLRTQVASMKEDQETIEVLSSHISSLEEEIKSLKSKNEATEEDEEDEAKSQHLFSQIIALEQEIQALKVKDEDGKAEEEKRQHLYSHISSLKEEVEALTNKNESLHRHIESIRTATQEQWTIEKQKQERLQKELLSLEKSHKEVQETLATTLAAANIPEPSVTSGSATAGDGYFDTRFRSSTQDLVQSMPGPFPLNIDPNPRSETQHPAQVVPGQSPTNPASTGSSPARSPQSESRSPGFRTVHGTHRADGSLGGYRADRGFRRQQTDDSLQNSSTRNGSVQRLSNPVYPLSGAGSTSNLGVGAPTSPPLPPPRRSTLQWVSSRGK